MNHPDHYTDGPAECIEIIRHSLTPMGFVGFCVGNSIKYTYRWRKKGGIEDIRKAAVYLNWAVETLNNTSDEALGL